MISKHERRAEELVADAGIVRPPVSVELLARKHDATIRYRVLDDGVSGVLLRTDDERIIGVNSSEAKVRQRFTIAHELGHLILHRGRPMIVEQLTRGARVNWRDGSSGGANDREEIEANQFAAALLMPADMVERDYWTFARRHTNEDTLVTQLARRYDVSPQAMRFRLLNLALADPT